MLSFIGQPLVGGCSFYTFTIKYSDFLCKYMVSGFAFIRSCFLITDINNSDTPAIPYWYCQSTDIPY